MDDEFDELLASDDESNVYSNLKSGSVFFVDCTQSMFKKIPDTQMTLFDLSIEVIHQYCLHNAFYNKKDFVSVVLFGTGIFQNPGDFAAIHQINELESVSFELLKSLEDLKTLDESKFQTKFNFSSDYTFPNLIWTLMSIFTQKKMEFSEKKAFLLSHEIILNINENNFNQSLAKYKDLLKSNIEFRLIPIGSNLVSDELQDEIKFIENILGNKYILPAINSRSECDFGIRTLCKEGRVVSKIPLYFDSVQNDKNIDVNDFKAVFVNLHLSVRESKPPIGKKIHKKTNEEVISYTYLEDSSKRPMMPRDCLYKLIEGSKDVLFQRDDLLELRVLSYPPELQGLSSGFIQIAGFIDHLDSEILYMANDNSYFVSCSKENDDLALSMFKSFVLACQEMKKYALCLFCPNFKSRISYCLLCPFVEESSKANSKNLRFGFFLKKLPFAEEFRKYVLDSEGNTNRTPDPQIESQIFKLMDKTMCSETPQVQNVDIQRMHSVIEAVALDKEEPQEIVDTLSMPKKIENDIQPILDKINASLQQY